MFSLKSGWDSKWLSLAGVKVSLDPSEVFPKVSLLSAMEFVFIFMIPIINTGSDTVSQHLAPGG